MRAIRLIPVGIVGAVILFGIYAGANLFSENPLIEKPLSENTLSENHEIQSATLVSFHAEQDAVAAKSHPIVAGFERSYAQQGGDLAEGGRLLLGELNCTACHAEKDPEKLGLSTKQAPLLGEIGFRARPEFLRKFIADPHATKPGTTMPSMFSSLDKKQRAESVEPLVHYLVSLSSENFILSAPDGAAVQRGEKRFHNVGCVACHEPVRKRTEDLEEYEGALDVSTPSIPLGKLEEKYSIGGLTDFLMDPLAFRASGRMPNMHLTAGEANDVASYLLRDIDAPVPLTVRYYEGKWGRLPDFDKLKPKFTGGVSRFALGPNQRNDGIGLRFDGFLNIRQAGKYKFILGSDDGSRLYLNGKVVVDNDGLHAKTFKEGEIELAVGPHAIRLDFFEGGGGEELELKFEGPGISRQEIPGSMLTAVRKPKAKKDKFVLNSQLVEQGRKLFTTAGCASCHQMNKKGPAIASEMTGKPMSRLRAGGGCLSDAAVSGRPDFRLNKKQTAALTAALDQVVRRKTITRTAAQRIDHTMVKLNCYACHRRNKQGGAAVDRREFFTANTADLGDEGRIPPLLTGVGDKLTDKWLEAVLYHGGVARDYMDMHMPQYGRENLVELARHFADVDRKIAGLPQVKDPPKKAKVAGHIMVGKTGVSCIACHQFNRHKSLGIQTMDLSKMTNRLRKDWFYRYMLDPQKYRPGTRMPEVWADGKSAKPKILDGDVDRQILAIWEYLSDGRRARKPIGLSQQSLELIVGGEAMIYRNFIAGAGPRGIAVGYPEEVSLALDANAMRIALLWQGQFMDASKHWVGRGAGFQPPLGEKVIKLHEGAPLAILADVKTAWPSETGKAAGYQFRGYRLDKLRRPEFRYQFGKIQIRDYPRGIEKEGQLGIDRTITLTTKDKVSGLWYRAAVGNVKQLDDGGYQIDRQLIIRFPTLAGEKPILRTTGEITELLVPIQFTDGKAKLEQQYRW